MNVDYMPLIMDNQYGVLSVKPSRLWTDDPLCPMRPMFRWLLEARIWMPLNDLPGDIVPFLLPSEMNVEFLETCNVVEGFKWVQPFGTALLDQLKDSYSRMAELHRNASQDRDLCTEAVSECNNCHNEFLQASSNK